MNFKKYIETTEKYIENKDRVYCILSLVADNANLIEKLEYFKNENSLILIGLGDNIFSTFRMMNKCGIKLDDQPIDIEALKEQINELDKMYVMSEQDIQKSLVMEIGLISNIVTNYMKYEIDTLSDDDIQRIKKSLVSYIVLLMLLICKYNFSIDRVLDFNIKKLEQSIKELNKKTMKDDD